MATPLQTAPRPAEAKGVTPPANTNRPLASFRFGSVSAAIFAEEIQKDGKLLTLPHVSLERSYRDPQGAWHYTHSLRTDDLLFGSFALAKCYEFLANQQQKRS